MAVENQVTFVGNLVQDPVVRYTNDGKPVASVVIAVNRRVFDKLTNAWTDKPDGFFDGSVWGDHGANVAASLKKGDRVIMVGRIVKNQYQDRDGNKRTAVEVQVDEIAPSLRWATASVTRTGGQNSQSGQAGGSQVPAAGGQEAPQAALDSVAQPEDDIPF